jgi:ABC-type phosphate/phosphonate transport system ATPase subunit
MADILPEYNLVTEELESVLENLPGKIIAIDGKNGSGKTTLGRYLSWYFNVTLLETDNFRKESINTLVYELKQLNKIIDSRLYIPRPIIIEAVAVNNLLEKLNRKADYIIYVENLNHENDDWLVPILDGYERKYNPKCLSNFNIEIKV